MIDKSKLSVFGLYFNGFQKNQGSFFASLFQTFLKGSGPNRRLIADAFPDYFNEYDVTLDYPVIAE